MISQDILEKLSIITDEEKEILNGNSKIDYNLYTDKSDNVITGKKLLSAGKLITVRTHTRFINFPLHYHDYVEVVYMCKGRTTHVVGGDEVILNTGELLFMSPCTTHEIRPAGKDDIAVNFVIVPEFFDMIIPIIGDDETPLRKFIIDCLKNKRGHSGYLHYKVADILPIQNLIENLIFTLLNDVPNKRNVNKVTMGLLFLHLINYSDRLVTGIPQENTVVRVLNYVEENYRRGSLTELAEILHYDFYNLSREIKQKTGMTYTELVQNKRMAQACFLLKNTDMNVIDISESVGYENISYFHRIFKSSFGLSPAKYRKSK